MLFQTPERFKEIIIMPIPKKLELQHRIDNALNIINALVYYDSDVSQDTKEILIQVIDILKGSYSKK